MAAFFKVGQEVKAIPDILFLFCVRKLVEDKKTMNVYTERNLSVGFILGGILCREPKFENKF